MTWIHALVEVWKCHLRIKGHQIVQHRSATSPVPQNEHRGMENSGSSDLSPEEQPFQSSVKGIKATNERDRDPSWKISPGYPGLHPEQMPQARDRKTMPHADQTLPRSFYGRL